MKNSHIAAVIPCYKVDKTIINLLKQIGPEVTSIYCVDDKCPQNSGTLIESEVSDPRVKVLYHENNTGVGGAVITGYTAALEDGADIIVKLDGDGQMDPLLIGSFVRPILEGRADYTKGNRFFRIEDVMEMPRVRIIGNAILSFFSKLSSGYWNIFDPANGYTAIHRNVISNLPLEKISKGFFFESDMLFRLNTIRAVVVDIPIMSRYGTEISNIKIYKIIVPFLVRHLMNFIKRIFYDYYLRNFNLASIELLVAVPLFCFGFTYGSYHWMLSAIQNIPATAGTVMLSGLPILAGLQLVISFFNFDISNVPQNPIHYITRSKEIS